MSVPSVSWVDFSITDSVKPFSLNLYKNDFLFLAGETCGERLLLALADFLPKECNFKEAIRVNGQRGDETFKSVLLPGDAIESFPPHRTIGQFALDLAPHLNKKKLENCASEYDIDKRFLYKKPAKISKPVLQKISLWLCSLNKSSVIFVEEPENGFDEECRPFDFLQNLLRNDVSESVVYLTNNKETILQKAKIMQLCRARLAIFCADRLVEEGEAIKILGNPVHSYTKEWLNFGSSRQLKNGALWQYCHPNCPEQHNNCQVKQNVSYTSWDCDETGLHKVICKGFFYFQ